MCLGIDQMHRVAEPASDCGIEHWHRDTGTTATSKHTVDKQAATVAEIDVSNRLGVVMDAKILLHNGDQHQHPKVCFGVMKARGVHRKTSPHPMGFSMDMFGPLIEYFHRCGDIDLISAWKSLSAPQVKECDVSCSRAAGVLSFSSERSAKRTGVLLGTWSTTGRSTRRFVNRARAAMTQHTVKTQTTSHTRDAPTADTVALTGVSVGRRLRRSSDSAAPRMREDINRKSPHCRAYISQVKRIPIEATSFLRR